MNVLFVAYRSGDDNRAGWGPVGMLAHDRGLYRFCYTQGAKTLSGFRPFPLMGKLDVVYEAEELFPVFANRLLSESRPEYEAYLRWGGFDAGQQPDPIAILGVTGGVRQTDSIELFPCPIPTEPGCYRNKFFLHGIRWMPPATLDRINRLKPDERLHLMLDPCNAYDFHAVALRTEEERMLIGYAPRYLAYDIRELLYHCCPDNIELKVDRLNLDAPTQQRVLCRLTTCWPEGFKPCRGEEFQPIPKEMVGLCASNA
jgi:hypothetical protein